MLAEIPKKDFFLIIHHIAPRLILNVDLLCTDILTTSSQFVCRSSATTKPTVILNFQNLQGAMGGFCGGASCLKSITE